MTKNPAKKACIFLNGTYHKEDSNLIRKQLRNEKSQPLIIAVDGGLAFLQKIDLKPQYWLTDLDSAPRIKKGFLNEADIMIYPAEKNKTDSELALDFCLKRKINDLAFWGWYDTDDETDHLLGNLMLVYLVENYRRKLNIRFHRSRQNIFYLKNEKRVFKDYQGFRLSTIPITKKIVLTLQGTKYPAKNFVVKQGQTVSLRNSITAAKATVKIEGAALVIIAG